MDNFKEDVLDMHLSKTAGIMAEQDSGSPARRQLAVSIGLIGPGRVGGALLAQIRKAQLRLSQEAGLEIILRGVANSRRMWLDCDDPNFELAFQDSSGKRAQIWRPLDVKQLTTHVRRNHQHAMLIDCSASDIVADHYVEWIKEGIHVVTPNKLAGSGQFERWQAIRAACNGATKFRYEATVCAGLPVLQTLRDLVNTGDTLTAIEGMFSGTLAWLFNHYDGSVPFSSLVRKARELGYSEPDPRSDLSGIDVARKVVILAREAGWPISLQDVVLESFVPPQLEALPLDEFTMRLEELDAPMMTRLTKARAEGGVLRHVAHIDNLGRAKIELTALEVHHPFAHTRLTDNIVQFSSSRYSENPLRIQGPGAGPEVTAAGVFADVLRIAESLSEGDAY